MTTFTEQMQEREMAVFWNEIASHLPKSIERSALGDEKICDAFRTVYPQIRKHVVTATLKEVERVVEGTEEYMSVKDNDTHRYQIPRSKKDEWDTFCDIPSDDERSWDVPEWAERIDGMPVTSYKDTIKARIGELVAKDMGV